MMCAEVSVNIMLDGPAALSASINLPGYPPTLIAVTGGSKHDVLDQPDDEPTEGETLYLYTYVSFGFLDYRDKGQGVSGKFGLYRIVPEGEYQCVKCGKPVTSPPSWPFERCNFWQSGYHELHLEKPPVIDMRDRLFNA